MVINYSSDILVVFIEGGLHVNIPFPQIGSSYNVVTSKSYVNVEAQLYKKQGDDLWHCSIDKDGIQLNALYKKNIKIEKSLFNPIGGIK